MSAYEIKQFINRSVSFFWTESEAQLYPTLKNLSAKNYVTHQEERAAKAGTKKVYTITKFGRDVLAQWLKNKTERAVYRNELLLKVFFGSNQSVQENIALIESAKSESEAVYKMLLSIKDNLQCKKITKKRQVYVGLSLDYGISSLKAEIAWCKSSLKKLQAL